MGSSASLAELRREASSQPAPQATAAAAAALAPTNATGSSTAAASPSLATRSGCGLASSGASGAGQWKSGAGLAAVVPVTVADAELSSSSCPGSSRGQSAPSGASAGPITT
eukprot:9362938-Pyramimonas_sp.AAC.2